MFLPWKKPVFKKNGTPVDSFDLLIAATAITNGLILVTNNVKHFDRFPQLIMEDWTKPEASI
jgi:tRNA(fMet)-specific endonuclease VapC